jgi:hypothetical protein
MSINEQDCAKSENPLTGSLFCPIAVELIAANWIVRITTIQHDCFIIASEQKELGILLRIKSANATRRYFLRLISYPPVTFLY